MTSAVFLDTTAQADRCLGHHAAQRSLSRILLRRRLVSSTYVLGEYKQSFVRDAVTLYALVLDSADLGDALIRFGKYRERVSKRMAQIFGNLVKVAEFTREDVLGCLEMFIEMELEARFHEGLAELGDETGCARAKARAEKRGKAWVLDISCRKEHPPACRIQLFLSERRMALELVRKKCRAPGLEKLLEALEGFLRGGERPAGRACQALGDLIIALEAPDGVPVCTSNVRDFRPICRSLGKVLLAYSPSPRDNEAEGKG